MEKEIIKSIEKLKIELYKIQCRNWIQSKGKGNSASGKTLESLLGKKEDRNVLPDYEGIELKVRNNYNKYDLHLFSCAFDSKPLEMKRLLKIGGYPDKKNPNYKVFQIRVDSISKKRVGKYSYMLSLNEIDNSLELNIYYGNSDIIYTKMIWTLKELKKRLEHKIRYLAIIPVKKEKVDNIEYFKYEEAMFYELKDFKTFVNLIKSGYIRVTFNLTYYHSGENYGNYLDKGTSFEIMYDKINYLFNEIDI